MLKRIIVLLLPVMLLLSLAGCGNETFEESTVSIDKNGKVLSYSVEDFDESKYSAEELEEFVSQQISDYKESNSDSSVKLNSLKVEDGVAVLSVSYADCEEYSDFSGEVLYNDSVVNAKADGYAFDRTFYTVSTDSSTADSGSTSDSSVSVVDSVEDDEIISNASYKVVITSERTDVKVNGVIKYVSDKYATLKSENTVDLCDNELIYEEGLVYIVYE